MASSVYLQISAVVSLRGLILLDFGKDLSIFWCQESNRFVHDDNDGGDRTFIEHLLFPRFCFNQFTCISSFNPHITL